LPWFAETLINHAHSTKPEPRVSIFVMGVNKWRGENEWPLARTKYTSMFLESNGPANGADSDGKLSYVLTVQRSIDQYTYNPDTPVPTAGGAMIGNAAGMYLQNDIEKRSDVVTYTSAAMNQDTEVTGPVKVILYVSTDVPSTDYTAKLVDVHPDGKAYNLCSSILRRSYISSPSGKVVPTKIEIDLTTTSNVFRKGHRIRLDISSSDFPRFDRNPNTGGDPASETNPRTAHQSIFCGSNYPSQIVLPIIPCDNQPDSPVAP
jgi:uncharacterized protein